MPGSGRSNIAISPKRVVIEENIDNNNIKKSKIVFYCLNFFNFFRFEGKKQKKSESKGLLSFFKRKKSQPNIDKNENENDDENDVDDDNNQDVIVEEEEKQDNDKKDDTNNNNKDAEIVENQSEV